MKRFRNRKTKEETEINLTPMLDVVFIMLIFFIVTTSFVKEAGIQVNRPSASTAEQKGKANIIKAPGLGVDLTHKFFKQNKLLEPLKKIILKNISKNNTLKKISKFISNQGLSI